jgi:hypothetical protein
MSIRMQVRQGELEGVVVEFDHMGKELGSRSQEGLRRGRGEK